LSAKKLIISFQKPTVVSYLAVHCTAVKIDIALHLQYMII